MPNYMNQAEIDAEADGRGVIPPAVADEIRSLRAAEQWERVDSVVIGDGAAARSRGWFDTWADFAAADQIAWFSGRDTGAGPAYVNVTTERTDWAQDLYSTGIEFIAPTGIADIEEDANDAQITPLLFTSMLPTMMSIRVTLADSDEIAKAPANHFPAGYGVAYPVVSAAAAPSVIGGSQGEPRVGNGWKWPEPVMLAAKAKISVFGGLDAPIRQALAALPGPGFKLIPDGAGGVIRMANWYQIKITHRGPRYLQLRGGRSSA
jgi:hypothetical protein